MKLAFMLGCALSMAAVAPAQVPTASSEARFIVFFDWSKPDINRDAAEILDKVAKEVVGRPDARLVLA
ncbi:MAG: hypothetical protein ACREBP_09770, partial [Sphingomicrobium sp.]